LFVEPAHVYRGTRVELEAVLANEDALPPGSYPARFAVFGPAQRLVWSVTTNVTIAATRPGAEPPFAVPVLRTELPVDGPVGAYRFVAAFERGGAAAGGEAEFHVAERALGPPLETEIVVWGEDAGLLGWLHEHGVRGRNFDGKWQTEREVILAAGRPPAPGGAEVFAELARRIEGGATAVFLSMSVFAEKNQPTAWVPLQQKGTLAGLPSWLYHKDEWAKPHPIFEGLPTGLLDYTFYRELIPDVAWVGLETPAEVVAGANDASIGYSAGLLVSVHTVGQGRIVLNTLTLREHLGRHPAADRLLWNMLRYAGR
jgi:hypothetical protein